MYVQVSKVDALFVQRVPIHVCVGTVPYMYTKERMVVYVHPLIGILYL